MSYFPPTIRYEYADESNISQASMYADPPLFKEEMSEESHYFPHSNSNNPSLPFPSSTVLQAQDDENLQPSVAPFGHFGIGDTSHDFVHAHCQPTPSSVDYFFWQTDDARSSSACCVEEKGPQMAYSVDQYDDQKQQMRLNQRDKQRQPNSNIEHQREQTAADSADLASPDQSAFSHQRHAFALKSGAVPFPIQRNNVEPLQRMPLQSMENAPIRNGRGNSSSDGISSPVDHFSTSKLETVELSEGNPPKTRSGPPAHWRVDETEKKQKRSVKRASFSKPTTYQIDEQGRQVIVVRGDDLYRSNDDDEERMEFERGVPSVARNGFVKPAYSYSCLIGLSLKNSDTGELTVSEIYAFLCYHFPYFREAPSGWKNSVRHNLSLNKCFQKIEVETPGSQGRKSCLWRMNPQKCAKMDQELRKWRDRDEKRILDAMEMPQNLDSLQNGTMGMPPNMKPRRFSIASSIVDENNHRILLHSSLAHHSQQQPQQFVVHHSVDPPPKRNSPPRPRLFDTPLTLDHQLSPVHQGSVVVAHNQPNQQHLRQCAGRSDASMGSSDHRQRHSVHAQAARKLENLLQQKQISSEPVADEAAGYFGGFTLIGGPSSNCGKKRRSSDNEFGN